MISRIEPVPAAVVDVLVVIGINDSMQADIILTGMLLLAQLKGVGGRRCGSVGLRVASGAFALND